MEHKYQYDVTAFPSLSTGHPMKRIAALLVLSLTASLAHAFPWYASGDNIRGAQLMTEQERHAYVSQLQNMKTLPECQAFWDGHNKEIDTRAAQQHVALPPVQGNPCQVMAIMGRIKKQ
jgi:hypothetical protein